MPAADEEDGVTVASTPVALPSGTVTFLFTDIAGSTQRWEQHPVAMRAALAQHDALIHNAVTRNGGVVVKGRGDGVLAENALAAGLDAQRALAAAACDETGPLQVRMAIHWALLIAAELAATGGKRSTVARLR